MTSGGGQDDPFATAEKQRLQPTKEQKDFAIGFEVALSILHQRHGKPNGPMLLNVVGRQCQQTEHQPCSGLSSTSSRVNEPLPTNLVIPRSSASFPIDVEQCLAIETPASANLVAVQRLGAIKRPLTSAIVSLSPASTTTRVSELVTNCEDGLLDNRKQQRLATMPMSFNHLDNTSDETEPSTSGVKQVMLTSGTSSFCITLFVLRVLFSYIVILEHDEKNFALSRVQNRR